MCWCAIICAYWSDNGHIWLSGPPNIRVQILDPKSRVRRNGLGKFPPSLDSSPMIPSVTLGPKQGIGETWQTWYLGWQLALGLKGIYYSEKHPDKKVGSGMLYICAVSKCFEQGRKFWTAQFYSKIVLFYRNVFWFLLQESLSSTLAKMEISSPKPVVRKSFFPILADMM